MSVLAQGNSTSGGVEEDILVPLLARLTNLSTLLDAAAPPAGSGIRRGPRLPPATAASPAAGDAAVLRARAQALLEKVRRDMVHLEAVFRLIDDAERRIRYGFDPVERHLDDALQHEPAPDAGRIHAALLAVDAGIGAIKASIREVYINLPCDDGGWDEFLTTAPPSRLPAPVTAAAVMAKNNMSEIRRGPQMSHLRLSVGGLEAPLRGCLLCLAAFPEGAVIKKRLLIHWWLAEGFVPSADEGKARFDELVARGYVVVPAAPNDSPCGTAHRCTVRPWMRDLLVSVAKRNGFLDLNAGGDEVAFARRACLRGGGGGKTRPAGFSATVRAIYNIGQKYVELDGRWFTGGKKDLRVLQLGQWREFSAREQIADPMASHIEVSGVERLCDMGSSCKSLRYVSFRGISGIESLPDSMGKLRELVVLDLRACHNLEELGQGIPKLDRLEYLDLSECHLLVGVPRGLGQLTRLEILKGFVVANSNSRDLCHLNELTKLERLRKLGIVVGKMAMPTEDEFLKLGELRALESLKISWGVLTSARNGSAEASRCRSVAATKYALPPNLKKLDLHCFPLADFAQWVRPAGVKKLYIRGGRLTTLGDEEGWEAEVLRLRFLAHLQCDHSRLRRLFRKLKPERTEIHECPKFIPGNDVGEIAEKHADLEEFVVCNDVVV